MKKIFVVPVVVFLLLCSMIPFTSYADGIQYTYTGLDSYYYTKQELEDDLYNNRNIQSDDYFYLKVCNTENFASNQWRSFYSGYYLFPVSNFSGVEPDISISEIDGVYTFSISNGKWSLLHGYSMCYYSYDDPDYRSFRQKQLPSRNSDLETDCSNLIFDSVNNTVTLSGGGTINLTYGSLYSAIIDVDFSIDGETYDPDALNVSVEVTPNLSGSYNRTTTNNGVSMTDDSFNFKVINNSRYGVQWAMAIVEEDAALPFNLLNYNERGVDTIDHTSDVKYVYISSELCYLQKGMSLWTTATINSPMHYTAANSNSGLNFIKWDMVNLEKNHNYDIVVYAVRNDADLTSYVESSLLYQGAYGDEVDLTNIQEVYRSTFSLVNPAVYNPDSSINGAVANDQNTDYDTLTNTMYSYTDVVDGVEQTIYGQYDYRSQILGQDKDLSYIDNYSGTGKFQKLMQNTSSVFGFYAAVLKFFPNDWLSMYQLGIFSLVVIAIIRRLT